jgi:hypothetical protein
MRAVGRLSPDGRPTVVTRTDRTIRRGSRPILDVGRAVDSRAVHRAASSSLHRRTLRPAGSDHASRTKIAAGAAASLAVGARTYATFDAHQAVAVDQKYFYVVYNRRITKHDKATGEPRLQFAGSDDGPTIHMDRGVVIDASCTPRTRTTTSRRCRARSRSSTRG